MSKNNEKTNEDPKSVVEPISPADSAISPEARALLEHAIAMHPQKSFSEFLRSIPNVGLDEDFERHRD